MAGKGTELQRTFLNFLFCTSGLTTSVIAGDRAATSTTTTLWVALHTNDPGNAGNQTTNEVAYTGYARIATQRTGTAGGWVISTTFSPCSVFPTSAITFPQCTTASAVVITNWSVGFSSATGTTTGLFYTGTVTPNINLGASVTPSLTTGTACTED